MLLVAPMAGSNPGALSIIAERFSERERVVSGTTPSRRRPTLARDLGQRHGASFPPKQELDTGAAASGAHRF
jgi:hypothetical protein